MEDGGKKFKVCLLGDGQVGKTSLIRRFVDGQFDEHYIMTVGTNISRKELQLDGHSVRLMIWDIIGQKGYESLRTMYYRGADGALLVCDCTRTDTLDSLRTWVASLKNVAGEVPMLFLLNKWDLDGKAVTLEDAQALASEYGAGTLVTSAKTGESVEQAFSTLATLIEEHKGRKRLES